ncbi:CLUMA_CG013108, isoform A [Clunio marinus]|uniref:CLUMA_CG013108, isoform A n=1 Tax=Clunio marinus TaxID=568069 RepID=A0A1J1IHX3_9DIPT|nr:CLUMA_CG013108, isoform A [Clunio marinus]
MKRNPRMGKEYNTNSMEMEQPFYVRQRPAPIPFHQFLYDSNKNTVLGRTGSSWAKIGLFYTIFYLMLAALVTGCMIVFLSTLNPRIPKWQLHESLIGTNPGLGFRPLPPEDNVESTLIWYKGTSEDQYRVWTQALDEFLEPYKKPGSIAGHGATIFNCDEDSNPPKGQVCEVKIDKLYPCVQENRYNYHRSQPCIFLKLNKIFGWVPHFYNDTQNLPDNMPEDLTKFIQDTEKTNSKKLNTIWVSCEGENPADIENIGPIHYYPMQGFPGYYYPFENAEGYLSPLVAVHFSRPITGIIINIECKAWAKNIKHDRSDRIGSVHFELLID